MMKSKNVLQLLKLEQLDFAVYLEPEQTRMNIYVIRQATQGLANWVKTQGWNADCCLISYDSRLKSDVFAKTAAGVLVCQWDQSKNL